MTEYRFAVEDGNIYRATTERYGDSDTWRWYWDGDGIVAFYDEGFRGLRPVDGADSGETERAMAAYRFDKSDDNSALTKVAQRVTGNAAADFIRVSLDRGIDLWVMVHDASDPDWCTAYRDEIEAVWHGDVYRIEVEELLTGCGCEQHWITAGDDGIEYYGEDKARAAFERDFPMAEFPAEMLVGSES